MRYPLLPALVVMCCLPLVSSCSFFRPQSVPPSPAAASPAAAIREAIPGLSKNTAANRNPQYETEEDLLKITTEFQRVEAHDTYRFPLPQDVTGANAYKATLKRLDDYQARHPGAYPVLVAFTRGRAYEGLHAYPQALEAYQRVSQTRHRLKDEATKSAAALDKFQELAERPISATTPAEYLQVLDEQAAAWTGLSQELTGTRYESLALEEAERIDAAKVTFLKLNRYQLQDGPESVIVAYRQLLDKHPESKNRYRYLIELGDFFHALAEEYVSQNDPEGLSFSVATFEELGQAALNQYAQVAQQDGVIEKLQARGKLQALEAYMAKIGRLGR